MKLPALPVRIVVSAVLLTAALVGMVVREGVARARGQEVRLEISGYDPRSLLTGHYFQFQMAHEFPAGTPCPDGRNPPKLTRARLDRETWIALKREGDHHVPSGVASTRAGAQKLGEVAARGRVTCSWGGQQPGQSRDAPPEGSSTRFDLGVDRLHLEQAQAEAVEARLRRGDIEAPPRALAILSIGRDGKARLKGVEIDGRRIELDWF